MPPSIFISAGEASGEHYGALLVAQLKARLEDAGRPAQFFGMGGERMRAAGLECVARSEDMAVMGLTEVIHHLPRIYREFRRLKQSIRERRPDVAILIDFPDVHFKLAEELHRLSIPVLFFVSPQLWAWKKKRIELVRKHIDRMLVIFPFEEQFYRDHGIAAEFVGHPLVDLAAPSKDRMQLAQENHLDPVATWIGLLPGSRPKEIRDNLPEILKAVRLFEERRNGSAGRFQYLIPLAPTLTATNRTMVANLVRDHAPGLCVHLIADARAGLRHARVSVVASGTATVEAALIGNPFVVVYRVSPITYAIAKRVVKVPHVAMANLIAGRRVVTELIQNDFTASNIVRELERLLPDGPARESMKQELRTIRGLLNKNRPGSEGAIGRVAEITLEVLGASSPAQIVPLHS